MKEFEKWLIEVANREQLTHFSPYKFRKEGWKAALKWVLSRVGQRLICDSIIADIKKELKP